MTNRNSQIANHKSVVAKIIEIRIALDVEDKLYRLFIDNGIAVACIEKWYPKMTSEQIAEAVTRYFSSDLLVKMNIPSADYNALARTAFQAALKRAIDDMLDATEAGGE